MSEKVKNIIIAILLIIVLALGVFIITSGNKLYSKGQNENGLVILDQTSFKDYDETRLVVKIKNASNKTFNNVSPIIIFKDENGTPFHEGWASNIGYFAPEDIRCLEVYEGAEEYSSYEVGLLDNENEDYTYTDLRDKIEYDVKHDEGTDRIDFHTKNNSDKEAVLLYQVAYYDGNKLFFEDQFLTMVDANGEDDTYVKYYEAFEDETPFPEGFKYEVTLVEAVDYHEEDFVEDDEEEFDLDALIEQEREEDALEEARAQARAQAEEAKSAEINYEDLKDEDKIEHALFQTFKKTYGSKMASAKIVVDKIYTAKEIEKDATLKSLDIKEDERAFEASIDFEPAEGADPMIFTIPDGRVNEANGWVTDVHRLGILTPDGNGDYTIRNFGTGW